MKSILFTIFFIVFQSVLIQGEEEYGLILDRYFHWIFQLPRRIPQNTVCGAWAVACPAETLAEKAFIKQYSFTKNGLFVKKIINKGSSTTELQKNQCKDSFKLSLTYNVRSYSFQFGFEMFYDLKDEDYFHMNKFYDYKSPDIVAKSVTKVMEKGKFNLSEFWRVLNTFGSGITELWLDNNKRMGFQWMFLINLVFTFSTKSLYTVEYNITSSSRWPVLEEQCTDFSLGSEFYKDIHLDELYAQKDESNLAQLKMPNSIKCKSNSQCFHKWLLTPLDQFRSGSSESPVCSNMVTIPIWKKERLDIFYLRRIDQYLYALFRYLGEPLHIVAGVTGEQKYSKRRGLGKTSLYLDMNKKKIPVFKIIYKMVEYKVKNCQLYEAFCWYSVIIIIHNDPLFNAGDRICPEILTTQWGWSEITKDIDGNELNFIYVCPRTLEVLKKLIPNPKRKIPIINAELKLSEFPMSKDGININKTDITLDVNRKLEEFIKDGEDFELETEKIMEMTHGKFVNAESEEYFKHIGLDEESYGPGKDDEGGKEN